MTTPNTIIADLQAEIAVLQSALSSAVEQRDLLIAAAKRAIGDEWVYLTDLRDTVKAVEQQSEHRPTSVKGGAADPTLHVADTRYPMRTTGGGVICLGGDNHLTDLEGEAK